MEVSSGLHQQGHRRSSPPVWSLHPVPEPECCSPLTPTPSCPWQMCATDIFTLEGVDQLLVGDFYSKMILVWCLPPGQSNANKVVSLLKEMFSEHGIPEVLCSDNGPQYASAQFADFCMSWGITHETSSLHFPQSNGFAEACIKFVKHTLQWAKYSSANPHLALLALWATPINIKLPSPAELLYQHQLRTTILAKIRNNDPSAPQVHGQIVAHSESAKAQADKCSKTLVPLYAGQPVATYNTLWKIWVPATVIHFLPCNSYQVHTSNGSHILLHMEAPLWMQCQSSWHCPKWHNCHTTGSVKTPLHSRITCITCTCTMHAAHLCCTCNTGNPDETGPQLFLPCQLFRRMPWHQCLQHPMPQLCSPKDLAMPTWHQDAWSRRSRNCWPRLSMDSVFVMCHCIHPQ